MGGITRPKPQRVAPSLWATGRETARAVRSADDFRVVIGELSVVVACGDNAFAGVVRSQKLPKALEQYW
jgi:hypothetical protein